jgi:hypothetical protein
MLTGWVLIGSVVYLSLTSAPPQVFEFTSADKFGHLFAYGALMGWFGQLYMSVRLQAGWAAIIIALGVALEFVQGWGGVRVFDVADMLANSLGVGLGWWITRGWLAGTLLRMDHALARLLA